jgi:hypothetical protein
MKKMSEKGRARVENAYTIQLMVFFFLLFQTGRFLLDSLNWMFDTTKEEQ